MKSTSEVIQEESRYLFQTYKRAPVVFARGEGCTLFDMEGRSYLDLVAGVAVNSLGHAHPEWIEALVQQARMLVHTSNLYYSEPMVALAKKLAVVSGMDRVFFCNSGTEANEAAIKVARKWGKAKRGNDCFKILTFEHAFHGRTLGALSATGQKKYCDPFEPLVPGFVQIPSLERERVARYMDESVCAVMIEPIQGEGGIRAFEPGYLRQIRRLCDAKQILFIADEVQTGLARTGEWFAFQHSEILPDICCLAKGLGGGFPIGACLARGESANVLSQGDHGSTFAANPLAARAALSVLEIIQANDLVAAAKENGFHFKQGLESVRQAFPQMVAEVRGAGLMLGLELKSPVAREVVSRALERGVILNATSDNLLRFLPPLIITKAEIEAGLNTLRGVLEDLSSAAGIMA